MLDYILYRMLLLGKRYYFNPVNLSGAESTVPEQATFKHSIPIFSRILFFIVSIISGFSFGCIIGMTVEPSDYRYCVIIHFLLFNLHACKNKTVVGQLARSSRPCLTTLQIYGESRLDLIFILSIVYVHSNVCCICRPHFV